MSNKVLITGGAGFIGLHLANHLLDHGYHVCLADNFARGVKDDYLNSTLNRENVTISEVDVLELHAVLSLGDDYDVIFHLAAIIGVAHVMERPFNVLYDNIRMLGNMLELAKQQMKLSRFMFPSTSEVYAGTLKYFELPIPTPEAAPLAVTALDEPRTSYMLSKIYGEAMCQQSGIPFTNFRPHNIYGPRMGMSHVIPEQLQKAHEASEGGSVDVYSLEHSRCFCYIDDAVEMLRRMIENNQCSGKTLNLGTQNPEVTMREVAETCIKTVGKNLLMNEHPATPGSPERRGPDMTITGQLTGYESCVGLQEGISKTYQWYKENIFEGEGATAK